MKTENNIYLETYTNDVEYQKTFKVNMPLQSFITYCVFKFCSPADVILYLVPTKPSIIDANVIFTDNSLTVADSVPWQISSCIYPVAMNGDTVITGSCAVARHLTKYRTVPLSSQEQEEGLLGFRNCCLQAPNEVSIWTKFCEVDIIKTVKELLKIDRVTEIPENLVRFESHLSKPVRVHNVYKIARNFKKLKLQQKQADINLKVNEHTEEKTDNSRIPKPRKWKSNSKKEKDIDCSCELEELDVNHSFAEGPFLTLADLVLLPSYYILIHTLGPTYMQSLLPLTMKWYNHLYEIAELHSLRQLLDKIECRTVGTENMTVPVSDGVSLYKCDPTRHNPKKRLFTKEDDIEDALNTLTESMKLDISNNEFNQTLNWSDIPDGANPAAGHLPDERVNRKTQQLENLTLAVLSIAKEGDRIVDFCSGSGHLGILIAYLLPKCTVILLETKEQSLLRARKRVLEMNLKNVYFFQCNLDFFVGKFDIGVALHACGIASDLVLDKCLKANAKFVLCPCCYGSLHTTDRLVYPRSNRFSSLTINQYLCIGHAADQTHEEHPLTARGDLCMALIDSDRARLAEEFGYTVTLSRLKPLSCTPKNNLLIGVPI